MHDLTGYSFTSNHEWVRPEGDRLVIGLTDYAQHALSDIVSVELPEPEDHHYEKDEELGITESINTTSEIRAPVAGFVVDTNSDLLSDPELINADPYGKGWIVVFKPDNMADVRDLLHADEYEEILPDDE
ncbi:MAG: glycine cleavage system protein GcvH [Lentisphaerae bacterium]|nr:glycine cleavage system protein GcvH [Lentisphaerota bacterium]